jgi:uncharacterized protein YcbK (DUF882 family)
MSCKPKSGESFESWFDRQGFENFTGGELASYFKRTRNTYPPKHMWTRFLPTMRIVQKVRTHFGKPVTISSSYRSPAYNAGVGGAKFSQHKEFRAADIQVKGVSPKRVRDYLFSLRRAGEFKGGIGLYRTFTHIDTRGTNATWG